MTRTAPEQVTPLLRDPDFRRYLSAESLSYVGTVITLIALPVLVFRRTGSAGTTALVSASEGIAYVLLGLFAGALTDRWNRQRVMIWTDLCAAVVVGSVPVAHSLGVLGLPQLFLVAFLGPALTVFHDGAMFGAVPTLVGRGRIAQANAYVWSVASAEEIVLPAVVGLALAVIYPANLMLVDAASFVVSALFTWRIRGAMQDPARVRPPFSVRALFGDIGVGLRWLWGHAGVRTMTVVGLTQSLAGGGFVALMVVWADRQLGIGTSGLRFGIVYGAWSIGGIISSVFLPRLLRFFSAARLTLVALPFSAVMGVVTPLFDQWWIGGLCLLVWSLGYTLVVTNSISYRQEVTPEPLLGRVNSAGRMLSFGVGWTGGSFLAGALVGQLGLRPTLLVMDSLTFIGVVLAWTGGLGRREPLSDG